MTGEWGASFETCAARTKPRDTTGATPLEQLEAAIWQAMRGMKTTLGSAPRKERVNEILAAAVAYAAGDGDHVTEQRRHVLHAMSAPIPEGTRR